MTEIQIYTNDKFLSPAADVQQALMRYQSMKDFIGKVLHEGVDFGVIPGTDKPTLYKPGAEKLSSFFGLAPKFEIVEKELDWTGDQHGGEPFFYFHYRARLLRGDMLAAEGEGSANSFEKKYRYRSAERVCPACGKSTIIKGKSEYGGGWLCFAKKGGCGAKYQDGDQKIEGQQTGMVKNPDIADVVNTLQKMAQKRAYVAAVLLAVNGSEYFTQDVEDFIDASFTTEPVKTAEPSAPLPQKQNAPKIEDILEPELERDFSYAVMEQGAVEHFDQKAISRIAAEQHTPPKHIENILKYCELDKPSDYFQLDAWIKRYRAVKNEGMTTPEAAAEANKANA